MTVDRLVPRLMLDHDHGAAGAMVGCCYGHLAVSSGDHGSSDNAPYIDPSVRSIPAGIAFGATWVAKPGQDARATKGTAAKKNDN